jgi:hypothetical protein
MSLLAKDKGGSEYENVTPGTYISRCIRVIDLGTQMTIWQGKEKESEKVLIEWELPMECNSDGEPFRISKRYTLSLHRQAALLKDLEAWRGKPFTEEELQGFHLQNILGANCMINITETEKEGKKYANVNSVMSLPKGMTKVESPSALVIFDLNNYDQSVYESLSPKLQEIIAKSPEFQALSGQPSSVEPEFSDDIPF